MGIRHFSSLAKKDFFFPHSSLRNCARLQFFFFRSQVDCCTHRARLINARTIWPFSTAEQKGPRLLLFAYTLGGHIVEITRTFPFLKMAAAMTVALCHLNGRAAARCGDLLCTPPSPLFYIGCRSTKMLIGKVEFNFGPGAPLVGASFLPGLFFSSACKNEFFRVCFFFLLSVSKTKPFFAPDSLIFLWNLINGNFCADLPGGGPFSSGFEWLRIRRDWCWFDFGRGSYESFAGDRFRRDVIVVLR